MTEAGDKAGICVQIGHEARRATMAHLEPELGPFNLTEWTNRAFEALWSPTEFPWLKIRRQFRDPDRLEIAIWVSDQLVGMALAVTQGENVILEFVEGDRSAGVPLKGFRTLIALDVATNYAQARGKQRLLVQPMNSGLASHYTKWGFSPFPPNIGSPYLWKKV